MKNIVAEVQKRRIESAVNRAISLGQKSVFLSIRGVFPEFASSPEVADLPYCSLKEASFLKSNGYKLFLRNCEKSETKAKVVEVIF